MYYIYTLLALAIIGCCPVYSVALEISLTTVTSLFNYFPSRYKRYPAAGAANKEDVSSSFSLLFIRPPITNVYNLLHHDRSNQ